MLPSSVDLDEIEQIAKAPLLSSPESNSSDRNDSPRLGDLLDEVVHLIQRHVRLPDLALAMLIAAWITQTYLCERFQFCGYLALRSATPRCGKSRLLRIIASLMCDAPKPTTDPTAAVLFRSQKRSMVLDEVDRLKNSDKETFGQVLAVLNVGFERGATVERVEKSKGGGFEVREFPVYRPIGLAGIEALADTLADRCLQIQMVRTPDRMPRYSSRALTPLCEQLRTGFQSWADAHAPEAQDAYEGLPNEVPALYGLDDRFQDIAEPLIIIAALADDERPEGPAVLPKLLAGLKAAAGQREPSGRERDLLALMDVLDQVLGQQEEVFISTPRLLELCQNREELSRLETGRALAGFLKHFELRPGFNPPKTERGYIIARSWFEAWHARYGAREKGLS